MVGEQGFRASFLKHLSQSIAAIPFLSCVIIPWRARIARIGFQSFQRRDPGVLLFALEATALAAASATLLQKVLLFGDWGDAQRLYLSLLPFHFLSKRRGSKLDLSSTITCTLKYIGTPLFLPGRGKTTERMTQPLQFPFLLAGIGTSSCLIWQLYHLICMAITSSSAWPLSIPIESLESENPLPQPHPLPTARGGCQQCIPYITTSTKILINTLHLEDWGFGMWVWVLDFVGLQELDRYWLWLVLFDLEEVNHHSSQNGKVRQEKENE